MNNTYIKLFIGVLLLATLVALTIMQIPHAERLVDLLYASLLGLGVTHLNTQSSTPPNGKEGGFASLAMLIVLGAVAVLLSGCASWSQAVQAYGNVAVTGARAANDTVIEAQKVTFCGLPLSAIARHPEIIPAVRVLCVASSDTATSGLLDAAAQQAKPAPQQ